MLWSVVKYGTILVFLNFCIPGCDGTERKLNLIRTGCPTNSTAKNVVYVTAEGISDTIHHIWSSIGSFTIFNALTSTTSKMTIDCDQLVSGKLDAIKFTEEPRESLMALLTKLYEFNDTNDKVDLPNSGDPKVIKQYEFRNFTWDNVTVKLTDSSSIEVMFNLSHQENETIGTDAIQLHISAYGNEKRFDMLPRLIHTSNSVQLEVIVDHALLNYESSRFAIEIKLLGLKANGNLSKSSTKSIDDEYTPGVFIIKQIESENLNGNQNSTYMQWKPTAYTSSYPHKHEASTMAVDYTLSDPIHWKTCSLELQGIACAYYGSKLQEVFGQAINVSFGMAEDEFYQKTSYMSWTFAVGYGTPPKDEMSSFIVIVISVGLGIPSVLLLGGSVFNAVRKRTKKDDLLLSSEQ